MQLNNFLFWLGEQWPNPNPNPNPCALLGVLCWTSQITSSHWCGIFGEWWCSKPRL